MKILPVDNNKVNRNFKSCFRIYAPCANSEFNSYGQVIIKACTNMLREDLDWGTLIRYVISHFDGKNKVNTYSLASSDGSEAYSYAIMLMENISKNLYSKYLPIKAYDVDKEVIKAAKSGRINIFGVEFAIAERIYGINLSKYLDNKAVSVMIKGDIISESDTISSYTPNNELKNAVIFNNSDILTELNKIQDDGNSVVMCRNVFPYLNQEYIDKVIEAAKRNLKRGSLFIIGDYDKQIKGIDKILLQNGFFNPLKYPENSNIFEKK